MKIIILSLLVAAYSLPSYSENKCQKFYGLSTTGLRSATVSRYKFKDIIIKAIKDVREKQNAVNFIQPAGVSLKSIAEEINRESQKKYGRDAIFAGALLEDPGMLDVPSADVLHKVIPRVTHTNYLTRTQQTEYLENLNLAFADRSVITVAAGLKRLQKGFPPAGTRPDLDTGDLLGGFWTRTKKGSLHVDEVEGVNAFNAAKDKKNGYGYFDVYSPAFLADSFPGPLPPVGTVEAINTQYGIAYRFVQPAGKTLADAAQEINKISNERFQRRAIDIEVLPNDPAMKVAGEKDIVHVVVPLVEGSNFKPLVDQQAYFQSKGLVMANRSVVAIAAGLYRLQHGFKLARLPYQHSERLDQDPGNLLKGLWTRTEDGWVSFQPNGINIYTPDRDAVGGYGHRAIYAAATVK